MTLRHIVRSAVTHFFPATLLTLAAVLGLAGLDTLLAELPTLVGLSTALTLGHVAFTWALRRYFRPDALGVRSRAVIAGVVSAAALFLLIVARNGMSAVPLTIAGFLAGVVGTLGMYFPWLRRRPSTEALAHSAPNELLELPADPAPVL